jgi:hypothetical protein
METSRGNARAVTGSVPARVRPHTSKVVGKWFVIVLTLVYLVLILAGKIPSATRLGWIEVTLVVLIVLLAGNFFDQLAELSLGKDGLHVTLNRIQHKQKDQDADIAAVRIAITGLVTKYEQAHLAALAADGPYPVKFGAIFFDEIRRLDSIGFIQIAERNSRGFNAIKEDHESNQTPFDLKAYMRITDEGRIYLQARARVSEDDR